METLKTIRLQLSAVEEAHRERRFRELIDTLVTVHDLVDVLASAFLSEQLRHVRLQLDRLLDIGLVVVDLEDQLAEAQAEPVPAIAAEKIENVWKQLNERLGADGQGTRFLLRTNIFPRGKKIFLQLDPNTTLQQVAAILRLRYSRYIRRYLEARGHTVAVPEAVDIVFFGSRIWDNPDEALLSEYARVGELARSEVEGVFWFPVLPGDSPVFFDDDEIDEEDDGLVNLLENFTIEADVNQLQTDMQRVLEDLRIEEKLPDTGWRCRFWLVKDEGTERETRIPLIGQRVTFGRGRENDIQILNDIKVSRFHCLIVREGDAFEIEDNSSSNGTFVNGELITRTRLRSGDELIIGTSQFRFVGD